MTARRSRWFRWVAALMVGIGGEAVLTAPAAAQVPGAGAQEVQTVVSARQTLDEFSRLAIESIPPAMLHAAEGVAIFPNMIKGGFILGVNYGRGVLCVRRPDRSWSAPVMVTMGGGSLGFQAGVQSADIMLVFATPRSLQGILSGQKVTLGADASVALGPIGRQANAGTDARLGAEIYSYARSRGLFAGVSLGGADLSVDHNADSMLYGRFGVTPVDVFENRGLFIRPEVQQLVDDLNARSRPEAAATAAAAAPAPLVPLAATPTAPGGPTAPGAPNAPGVPGPTSFSLPVPPAAAAPVAPPIQPVAAAPSPPAQAPVTPPLVPIR